MKSKKRLPNLKVNFGNVREPLALASLSVIFFCSLTLSPIVKAKENKPIENSQGANKSVEATSSGKKSPKLHCEVCEKIDKMRGQLEKLDPKNDDLRFKGEGIVLDAAKIFEKFEVKNKNVELKTKQFVSMIELAAVADPFDGESQLGQIIFQVISKDSALKKTFEEKVNQAKKNMMSNERHKSCSLIQLDSVVEELSCFKKLEEKEEKRLKQSKNEKQENKSKDGKLKDGTSKENNSKETSGDEPSQCVKKFDLEACQKGSLLK